MRLATVPVFAPGLQAYGSTFVGLDVIEIVNEGNVQDIPGEASGCTQSLDVNIMPSLMRQPKSRSSPAGQPHCDKAHNVRTCHRLQETSLARVEDVTLTRNNPHFEWRNLCDLWVKQALLSSLKRRKLLLFPRRGCPCQQTGAASCSFRPSISGNNLRLNMVSTVAGNATHLRRLNSSMGLQRLARGVMLKLHGLGNACSLLLDQTRHFHSQKCSP